MPATSRKPPERGGSSLVPGVPPARYARTERAGLSPVQPSSQTKDQELPDPAVLAAMLLAVESDRRELLNRVAAGFEEEVEAVARLYWPFLVVHGEGSPGAAVFDLTGVWKRSFQYSFLPSTEKLHAVLDGAWAPDEFLARMREVTQSFAQDAGAEALTVEGFLPLDPVLQLDLLAQASVASAPPVPEAGFLPARHQVGWYEEEVARMRQWLARLDSDLDALRGFRHQAESMVQSTQARLEQVQATAELEARQRALDARQRARGEIARVEASHHGEVLGHLEGIGDAHHAVAYGETAISTAATLADRATSRRDDPRPFQIRAREARTTIRSARRQIRESQRAIEGIYRHQREAQEEALASVAQTERSGALTQAHQELLRDHFLAGASDLIQAVDGQIAARQAQKDAMSGYFLPLPAPASTKIVWLPIWAATLRSPRGVRQIVFPPLKVRESVGVGGSIRRLFGGMVLPFEPRAIQFDREFRSTIEQALASDPWLANVTREMTATTDLLSSPKVLARFEEGLSELRRKGWISQKQAIDFLRNYTEVVNRRHKDPSAPERSGGSATHQPAEVEASTPALVPSHA